MNVIQELKDRRIIPVAVLENKADTERVLGGLVGGGLPVAEITYRTAYAEQAIADASEMFPDNNEKENNMKYGMWLDEWFRNYIQPSSKIKTCERYSEIIEKHLKVKLGEYELDELTPLVLQRYVTGLMQSGNIVTGKGLAANSVNGINPIKVQQMRL